MLNITNIEEQLIAKATMEKNTQLWKDIEKVGGVEAYIQNELALRNITARPRQSILKMSPTELEGYIADRAAEEKVRNELKHGIWEAYKSTHLVELGEGIFWQDAVGVDFFDPYKRLERLEDNALPKIETVAELIKCLSTVVPNMNYPLLRWYCYHRDVAETVHYHQFSFPKKSGGTRQIWAPLPNMKAMQKWILENILDRVPTHDAAHGFIRNRSIVSNASVHTNSSVVLNMDVKDFFPTLTFPRVKGIFRAIGYLEGIATLLALICTEAPRVTRKIKGKDGGDSFVHIATGPRCLPQGSPASPMLTNIACLRLDRRLSGLAKKYGFRYTRYADDLTFSFPEGSRSMEPQHLIAYVSQIVKDEGFRVHPDKTSIQGKGKRQEVTGLVVNNEGHPRVNREVRRMLKAAIHNQEQGKSFHEDENLEVLLGYASYIFSADPIEGREKIEQLLRLVESMPEE